MSSWQELKNNPRLLRIYRTRLEIVRGTREFFWARGFAEAETPLAVRLPGQEPYLNPVPVMLHDANGGSRQFYLHTSPEFSLKKLLAAGFSKIFEITKTFRDGEAFRGLHSPEFTMLEWYRAPGTYGDFMEDLEQLFKYIAEKLQVESVQYRGVVVPVTGAWDRVTMKALWQKYLQVNLDEYLETAPLTKLAASLGLPLPASDEYEDIFYTIFLNKVEPYLGKERPLFVYDYPAILTSLSRRAEHDARYAERVECYIAGVELCNGFGELTDAARQEQQLERDRALRQKLGKPIWPVDPQFLEALKAGPKSAAGVAMGLDRMVLLFTGAKDINEVIFNSQFDQLN